MPYANNKGVKIYYEVEGEGPPLVMAHGAGGTLESWRARGYTAALKDNFKMVLFDARGHGRSDKFHEESAYASQLMVDDVIAVLDDLGIGKAHYFGYSMGAWVGFRVPSRSATRFQSFILGGGTAYNGDDDVRKNMLLGIESYKILLADPEAFLRRREKALGRSLTSGERDMYLGNDAKALIALVTNLRDWPSVTNDELSRISAPCLIYCGDLDPVYAGSRESANHVPGATFVSLPGLDHGTAQQSVDPILPHVNKFLASVKEQ